VALPETTLKIFGHHLVGEVRLRVTSLTVATAPATRMLVYTPTDEASRVGVAWLAGHPDAPACDHHHHHEAAV
jgi:hypothetical protein